MLIEGKLPANYRREADTVKDYYSKHHGETNAQSRHYWIDCQPANIKESLEVLRNAPEIVKAIQNKYPEYKIKAVHSSDEVYISVDPSLRKNSDIALSDCHYDAPFKYVPQCGNVFVRVILGLTENSTTFTTIDSKKSLLSTLDFNGMDYNNDYHCVEGYIPKGQIRILLKLHFLCIHPDSSKWCADWTQLINDKWTHWSREAMRRTVNPTNILDCVLGQIIVLLRTIYNKINFKWIIVGLIGFIIATRWYRH